MIDTKLYNPPCLVVTVKLVKFSGEPFFRIMTVGEGNPVALQTIDVLPLATGGERSEGRGNSTKFGGSSINKI